MGEALVDIRRRIENATEAAAVKSALTDAASLDASCWKPGETLGWLTFLLEIVLPGWLSCFTIAERECIFDVFFIRAPPQDALSALHGYLCREGVSAEGLNPLIEIMTRRVPALICHAAGSSLASTSLWQMTLTSLFSLPERLANRTTRLPESLHPKYANSCASYSSLVLMIQLNYNKIICNCSNQGSVISFVRTNSNPTSHCSITWTCLSPRA